jgi:hypothetical protein
VRFAHDHPAVAGLALGAGIFVVMNFVVLPLSAYPFTLQPTLAWIARNLGVHLSLGLTIAAIVFRGARAP